MSCINAANVGRWFDAHARALVLYARQWMEDESARDAVQEAFMRLLRLPAEPANVPAWLYRTVRNAALDGQRADRRRRQREQRAASQRGAWFESRPGDLIDGAAAEAALAKLPGEQREVIVLRLWSGLSLAEVAAVCQAPVSTVFSRYRAGLAALRQQLESSCKPIRKTTS
jgi:RNA polymerase sigma factor (sigma-70 family)